MYSSRTSGETSAYYSDTSRRSKSVQSQTSQEESPSKVPYNIQLLLFLILHFQSKKIQILKDQKAKVDREREKFLEMKRKFQDELMDELKAVSEVKTKPKYKYKH